MTWNAQNRKAAVLKRCQRHGAPGDEAELPVAVSHLQHLAFLGFLDKRLALQHDSWHKPSPAYLGAHLLHELAARAPDLLTCWQLSQIPSSERSCSESPADTCLKTTIQKAGKLTPLKYTRCLRTVWKRHLSPCRLKSMAFLPSLGPAWSPQPTTWSWHSRWPLLRRVGVLCSVPCWLQLLL